MRIIHIHFNVVIVCDDNLRLRQSLRLITTAKKQRNANFSEAEVNVLVELLPQATAHFTESFSQIWQIRWERRHWTMSQRSMKLCVNWLELLALENFQKKWNVQVYIYFLWDIQMI